jgi:hypothetical protein
VDEIEHAITAIVCRKEPPHPAAIRIGDVGVPEPLRVAPEKEFTTLSSAKKMARGTHGPDLPNESVAKKTTFTKPPKKGAKDMQPR